jgi:hypothetical protein
MLKRFSGSKLQIDLCAYTLYYIFERGQLAQALHERVRASVRVRILVGDPANPNLFANTQLQTKAPMGGQMKFVAESIATWKSNRAVSNLDARKLGAGPLPISNSSLRRPDARRALPVDPLHVRNAMLAAPGFG